MITTLGLLPHSTYFIRQFLILVLFVSYCFGEIMCIWDSYVYQKGVLCFLVHKSYVRSIKRYCFVRKCPAIPVQLIIIIIIVINHIPVLAGPLEELFISGGFRINVFPFPSFFFTAFLSLSMCRFMAPFCLSEFRFLTEAFRFLFLFSFSFLHCHSSSL